MTVLAADEPSRTSTERSQRELSEIANARIRDTAKWLIGAFAAVGAALVAGTQLSNLGKLPLCTGGPGCNRLWAAMAGLVIGIGGVGAAIWIAAAVMTRPNRSTAQLKIEYDDRGSFVRQYFDRNPVSLHGFSDVADLINEERQAYEAFDKLSQQFDQASESEKESIVESLSEADDHLADVLARSDAFVSLANQISFSTLFSRRALPGVLGAALAVALGLGLFAWAANPVERVLPSAGLAGADLSGSDLTNANLGFLVLDDANFSGANLTNASLDGASVEGAQFEAAIWHNTTCPDGTNSDDNGGTCENHLRSSDTTNP